LKVRLTKRKGESEEHFKSRSIFANFLESKYPRPIFLIVEEYPPYRPRARGDLVVIRYTPPRLKIEMWIEIQETPLNPPSWRKKLLKIKKNYKVRIMTVVLTEKTKNQTVSVVKILKDLFSQFFLFVIDLTNNFISRFETDSGNFIQVGCL